MILLRAVSLLLIVLVPLTIAGQGKVADSLERKLTNSSGQAKVDILNQLTFEFISVDNGKVARYNSEALALARETGYVKGEGVAFTHRGVTEYQSGQFDKARVSLLTGLRLSRRADAGGSAHRGTRRVKVFPL